LQQKFTPLLGRSGQLAHSPFLMMVGASKFVEEFACLLAWSKFSALETLLNTVRTKGKSPYVEEYALRTNLTENLQLRL
jgi:hypothetical protein